MRVNIISNFQENSGLSQDANLLRGVLTAFIPDVRITRVPHMLPECPEAELNIFLEVISPVLIPFARKNVWIPNPEWTYKTWIPYLKMIDEVWAKTTETQKIFESLGAKTVFTGWSSLDKAWDPSQPKNYNKAIVPVGRNIFRYPKPILQAYERIRVNMPDLYEKLPELHIVYNSKSMEIFVPDTLSNKVVVHAEMMPESEYNSLLKECGLCICISVAEGFGHAVNEAMSAGCNVLVSDIQPFKQNLVDDSLSCSYYANRKDTHEHPDCLGILVDSDVQSIVSEFEIYCLVHEDHRRQGSTHARENYVNRHNAWIHTMKLILQSQNISPYSLKDTFLEERLLPNVSIVTITKDRRVFMPLAKYSYMIQSYPEDKLEWIIVDDGDDAIDDTLFGVPNVVYVRCPKGMSISDKRNLGVDKCMYEIVAFMDDDDVYPNNSILQRVAMMLKTPSKECAFCTTIPCYDIVKYSSFMNVPPMVLPMSQRVSEATLIFTKSFWQEKKFDSSVNIAEADAFIRGREYMCREISPQEVIVSLVHPFNTSGRRIPHISEPNGCHYGFNEKLFDLVSQIGQEIKT
jgi:hypothetical protein